MRVSSVELPGTSGMFKNGKVGTSAIVGKVNVLLYPKPPVTPDIVANSRVLGEDTEFQWMGDTRSAGTGVEVQDLVEQEVEEWTDGSRMDGRAAGATTTESLYLGEWATVADAEEMGVLLAWDKCDVVGLDSQGVIRRISNLLHARPRSWIEEGLVAKMRERPRVLMWVKGHSGVQGNEAADRTARREVEIGWRTQKKAIATPAGIKQGFPVYPKAPAHMKWSPRAVKGLVYMVTDKGPQRQWLWEIGGKKRWMTR